VPRLVLGHFGCGWSKLIIAEKEQDIDGTVSRFLADDIREGDTSTETSEAGEKKFIGENFCPPVIAFEPGKTFACESYFLVFRVGSERNNEEAQNDDQVKERTFHGLPSWGWWLVGRRENYIIIIGKKVKESN